MKAGKTIAFIKRATGMIALWTWVIMFNVSLLLLPGCVQSQNAPGRIPVDHEAPSGEQAASLESGKQSLSYALGMILGNQFREQSVEIDAELYLDGLEDALQGRETRLTEIEARHLVNQLQRDLRQKQFSSPTPGGQPTGIEVSFKLDPRLTKSMYMGDRWVSPPTFTIVQDGREAVIEAQARGTNAKGRSISINPTWTSADPGMVTIDPGQGDEVRITVQSAGETRLQVEAQGLSKSFDVKAYYVKDTIQVEIAR